MAGVERDIEQGILDEGRNSTPEGESLNLSNYSPSKAMQDKTAEVPDPYNWLRERIERDFERMWKRTTPSASALVESEVSRRIYFEPENSGSGEEPPAGCSTPLLTESQVVARLTRASAENASEAAHACRRVVEIISGPMDVFHKRADEFWDKAREDTDVLTSEFLERSARCLQLAKTYDEAERTLRKEAAKLGIVAGKAEHASDAAIESVRLVDEITNESDTESRRRKHEACRAMSGADAACIVAHKIEHHALRCMRKVWSEIPDADVQVEDNSEDSTSDEFRAEQQQCENRKRKTRIAHVASLFIGIAFFGALALLRAGSDSFYAVLCLAVLTEGWSLVYWGHQIYQCVKRRLSANKSTTNTTAAVESRENFLSRIEERLNYLQGYLEKNAVTPVPSDSENEDE